MWNRLRAALNRHGLLGILRLIPHNLAHGWQRVRRFDPGRAWRKFLWHRRDRAVERQLGIATTGELPLHRLTITGPNAPHGVQYTPTPRGSFQRALEWLDRQGFPYPDYTFIDYGAGKGRALLLAAQRPFREVVGVEFAAELVAAARANLAAYGGPPLACPRIRCEHGDATRFPPPGGNLLAYLYNPFGPPVLEAVLERLRQAARSTGGEVWLLYLNPVWSGSLGPQGFRLVHDGGAFHLYRLEGGGA